MTFLKKFWKNTILAFKEKPFLAILLKNGNFWQFFEKMTIFWEKLQFLAVFWKKMASFWQFLTFKWQFFGRISSWELLYSLLRRRVVVITCLKQYLFEAFQVNIYLHGMTLLKCLYLYYEKKRSVCIFTVRMSVPKYMEKSLMYNIKKQTILTMLKSKLDQLFATFFIGGFVKV